MTKLYAIHEIRHRPDPKKDEVVVKPGSVFDPANDKDANFLHASGAARPASETELQLYALANGATLTEAKDDDLLGEGDSGAADPGAAKGGKK